MVEEEENTLIDNEKDKDDESYESKENTIVS